MDEHIKTGMSAYTQFLQDLLAPVAKERQVEVSKHGVFIEATDDAAGQCDAAEILYALFCQPIRPPA